MILLNFPVNDTNSRLLKRKIKNKRRRKLTFKTCYFRSSRAKFSQGSLKSIKTIDRTFSRNQSKDSKETLIKYFWKIHFWEVLRQQIYQNGSFLLSHYFVENVFALS